MHRLLKELLPKAKGESHLVVVVFADVRGFSSFARMAESSEAALFLRSIYRVILDEYFQSAAFFKPTGDGLLIIIDYDDETLVSAVNNAVEQAVRLVEDFPSLTEPDPMVNFDVPAELGVGIARGAATALVSSDHTLDYSGRPLNLAARLMDLARPRGVVFNDSLGLELLEPPLAKRFEKTQAFVRSISEDEPMRIHVLKDTVLLPESSRYPINRLEWRLLEAEKLTLRGAKERSMFLHDLPEEPAVKNGIRVHVSHRTVAANGRQHPEMRTNHTFDATYLYQQRKHYASVEYEKICGVLAAVGVKATWELVVQLEYAVRPTTFSGRSSGQVDDDARSR